MTWTPNPYLDAFLRSPEGQAYLEKHGSLDAWKRRHMLDDLPIDMPMDEYFPAKDSADWLPGLSARPPVSTDPWDF
jgi:hypothetical protein